ncbi:helix-turn-helix domain-containing protein [Marinilactibacillus sp. GCM10026970]|uniref:helix-turn-helix domain-containing protein n=1 Tax=unclassified Marinilactibacillus TaxID=2632303 RepID=UPI001CE4302E|nr:helix-turn-helix domain-containing protein [Marinilactibacillus sp. Marseille-P9653]
MELWIIIGILFGISAILLVVSFLKKEEKDRTYKELEDVSLNLVQIIYGLNKRVKTLEKELKIENPEQTFPDRVTNMTQTHILTLFTQGLSAKEISEHLHVSEASVQHTIDAYIADGIN